MTTFHRIKTLDTADVGGTLIASGLTYPTSDGVANQHIITNGVGVLSWGSADAKVTYTLSTTALVATNSAAYETVGYFAWDNSAYSSYTNGAVRLWLEQTDYDINVRLRNITEGSNVCEVLAPSGGIVAIHGLVNPSVDARIELQIQRAGAGSTNPSIHGVTLEFDN